jgi:hypothetical protein
MPMLMRIPVTIVGVVCGKITRNALRKGLTSSVLATFSHSRFTVDTPNAVFKSIGHTEQMKMTNTPDMDESLMV